MTHGKRHKDARPSGTLASASEVHPSLWAQGWYKFAHRIDSPNFGPRPAPCVDLIVVHSISLPPGEFGNLHVQELFTNQLDWTLHPYFKQMEGLQVSAHFFIRRGGALLQFVSCDDRAWHAGQSHYRGRDNCNDDSVGIELEGLEGGEFEGAQYETLVSLCAAIEQRYPIEHVAGHEHVARGRKIDPGAGFDWVKLQQSLPWPRQYFPQCP